MQPNPFIGLTSDEAQAKRTHLAAEMLIEQDTYQRRYSDEQINEWFADYETTNAVYNTMKRIGGKNQNVNQFLSIPLVDEYAKKVIDYLLTRLNRTK